MEKGRQKGQNFTVKTRKNRTNPERNSLIDHRIDDNFLNDLDKVRGSARCSPNDPTPCRNHQASICDYRGERDLDRMPPFGLVKEPRMPRRTRRSIEAQQMG